MLSRIKIKNFKSFVEAEIRLRPLTVMIGANASGKTNFIEALGLLGWMADAAHLSQIHSAVRDQELALRGPIHRLTRHGNDRPIEFEVDVDVSALLRLTLEVAPEGPGLAIHREILVLRDATSTIYEARQIEREDGQRSLQVNPSTNSPPFRLLGGGPVFPHAVSLLAFHQLQQQLLFLALDFSRIAVFQPIPDRMRGYASISDWKPRPDGANLSAVLHHVCQLDHKDRILEFVRALPEQNILDLDFIQVPDRDDIMVKLLESFGPQEHWQEAAVLSDGTLRALAIAAALLSAESLLIIEDIDDGVHPSRLGHMLELIRHHAEQQGISVLVTTHNPALLDALPDAELRHVVACYRDPEQGDSRLIELGQLNEFPALAARGPLGELLTRGIVDHALKHDRTDEQRAADALAWLAELEASE
jgi:predicted ATPase